MTIENKTDGQELSAGLTANHYETDQTRYTLADWRSMSDKAFSTQTFGKTRQLSAWVEARFPMDPFTLTMAARYDNWRAFDGGLGRLGTGALVRQRLFHRYDARREDALNPDLSLEYRFPDDTQAQLSLGMATRFPTVGELFQGSLNGDGTFNITASIPTSSPSAAAMPISSSRMILAG